MTVPFKTQVRLDRVRVLLATRSDYLIEPHRDDEPRKLTASKFVPCVGLYHGGSTCLTCGGSGTRRRTAADPEWDAYTGSWITAEDEPARYMTPYELDSQIEHLERNAAEREGRDDDEVLAEDELWWERARNRRDRDGSYVELEDVLRRLDIEDVVFLELYHDGLLRRSPGAERREQRLVTLIESQMPRRIIVPQWAYDRERDKLALYIKTLEGWKTSDIAKEVGVSRRRVKQLRAMKVVP